jgi:hypothetical protein
VGEQKDTVDLQRTSLQTIPFFTIVLTLHFYNVVCVVFGNYWCIIWGMGEMEQGGRKIGRITLFKIWGLVGKMVK